MATNEQLSNSIDKRTEPVEQPAGERRERDTVGSEREPLVETAQERSHERTESARQEVERVTAEHERHEPIKDTPNNQEKAVDTKVARDKAYQSIMLQTRSEMSAPNRSFSKVVHNPIVEKISDVASTTIARPNAILSGAVLAFVLTLVIYSVAKMNGYPLTGTEAIAAFVIGWIIGNLYDFVKTMIRGGR